MDISQVTNELANVDKATLVNYYAQLGKALGTRASQLGVNPHPIINKFQSNVRTGMGVANWNKFAPGRAPSGSARGKSLPRTASTTTTRSRSSQTGRSARKPATSRARRSR